MIPGSGTPSGILAWRISWTEDPGGLQSTRSKESFTTQRVTLSPGSQGCLSPAHPKPAAWKLVPGVWRAPSEKEGPPTKLVWGRQVRLQPLQAPSTGGSVGSWGPKGPCGYPPPPPRPSHLPRENTTEAGHGSGLCSWGWEACSRGLVSHWDPGLPFPGAWTEALSATVLSLSISESGISESPAPSTTSGHAHACARVVGGGFEGNNLTGQRVHPRNWRKRLCPVASGPIREHQKHPPKQPPAHSSVLV